VIFTSTPSFENREISEYCGIVAAEAVVTGGSVGGSVEVIDGFNLELTAQTSRFGEARARALAAITSQAEDLRADAIVGLRFEYCTLGKNGLLNMVSAYGTAVRIRLSKEDQERRRIAELRERTTFLVLVDGKQRGPFSITQLSELVEQGRVSSATEVQDDVTGEKIPISDVLSR